jgi:D-sedoheptulose 7-phosphate isomerase
MSVDKMIDALQRGNKIMVFGNGGSSTQSSHFAAELVNRFYFDRKPLPGIALNTDIANLTAIANDSDYKYVFSRQLEAIGKAGDVAIGLSTSGRSANVLEAFKQAKKMGIVTVALCGEHSASMSALETDVVISVPSNDTPSIQEMHLFVLHTIADLLEKHFFGGEK